MRRKNSQRANSLACLRNSLIETLEPRNAVSTVSIASASIPVGSAQGSLQPAGALASLHAEISPSRPHSQPERVTSPSIPGKIGFAVPHLVRKNANPTPNPIIPNSFGAQASPAHLISVAANKITITPIAVGPQVGNHASGAVGQPVGGGFASASGAGGQVSASLRGAVALSATAGQPASSSAPVGAVSASNQPATPIRPLSISAATVPGAIRTASTATGSDFYSGGGNERIPHLDFSTLTMTTPTDNEDPNNPGTYLETTNVTDVIGGYGGVVGLDGEYSTFAVTVSGGAVYGPAIYTDRSGMWASTQFTGTTIYNQIDPGTSWYWDQFSGTRTVTVDVTYPNGDYGSASFEVNVQNVTGNLIITPAPGAPGPRLLPNNNGGFSFVASASFDGTANAPYVSGGGLIGFTQTLDPADTTKTIHRGARAGTQYHLVAFDENGDPYINGNGNPSSLRPILDDEGGIFYADALGVIGDDGNTTAHLTTSDNPGIANLDQSNQVAAGDGYRYNTGFSDTLMYKPDAGIWVPLGTNGWTVIFDISKQVDGTYKINNAPDVMPVGYRASTQYPTWNESIFYIKSTPSRGLYSKQN